MQTLVPPKIVRINDIIEKVSSYYPEADVELIQKAYVFSAKVHHGQTRLSGEPYLSHPLSVAMILADLHLDVFTIVTGLLHDTVEDTYTTIQKIEEMFGSEIAFLVDGVTKISKISSKNRLEQQAENFRKMILAMSKDIRVVLVKLADRVHNMQTLVHVPPEKQKRTAQQTLDIYAPLANRLGLFLIKRELEDLSLRYLHEEIYNEIHNNLVVTSEQRTNYVKEVIGIIKERLDQFGIEATIIGRPKHAYSIYNKMLKQNLNFNQIYDLTAVRIIVETRNECYEVLGLIHSIWKPIPGRFKDFISLPKPNMYQSLHTTVVGHHGQRVEIQIRTHEMDKVAKQGIAAHWKYKEGRRIEQKDDQRFAWLQQLMESHQEMGDSQDFLKAFRVEIFPENVYVFTPTGEVFELPSEATPIDFAYRIHTDVGHRCVGALVNGAIVPLKYHLQTGDVVEILTQPRHTPSRDWLKIVRTSRAKTKIRQWVKQQERERSISLGREICEKEFRKAGLKLSTTTKDAGALQLFSKDGIKSYNDLFAAVGQGRLSARHIINRLSPDEEKQDESSEELQQQKIKKRRRRSAKGIRIQGIDDIMVRFGKCCNPIQGDSIKGFITRGRGVTIHTIDCPFIESADPERVIDAQWDESAVHVTVVPVEVISDDKQGLLADITTALSSGGTNIVNARVKTTPDKKAVNVFELEITSLEQLDSVMNEVKKIRGVLKIARLRP